MFIQKLSIVVMLACGSMVICFLRCFFNCSFSQSAIFSLSFPSILVRICAAAALVKVTTTRLSISILLAVSDKIETILSVRTAVFPAPAEADTRIFLPRRSIAFFCSGRNSIFFSILLSPLLPYLFITFIS